MSDGMKRSSLAILVCVSLALSIDLPAPGQWGTSAMAQGVTAKEAFEAAKELGTAAAWNAFLASYPTGFYADLARAYLKKLAGSVPDAGPSPPAAAAPSPASSPPALPQSADIPLPAGAAPRAVLLARTTTIPRCTLFVDAAAATSGNGTAQRPHNTIAAAVAGRG